VDSQLTVKFMPVTKSFLFTSLESLKRNDGIAADKAYQVLTVNTNKARFGAHAFPQQVHGPLKLVCIKVHPSAG
jgi:hypothetical protein